MDHLEFPACLEGKDQGYVCHSLALLLPRYTADCGIVSLHRVTLAFLEHLEAEDPQVHLDNHSL